MLVDSHCHLASEAFRADLPEVLDRAWAAGVGHVVVIGESREAVLQGLTLAGAESRLSVTAGVHPHDASTWTPETGDWLAGLLQDPRVVALGEIGLDYHYDHSPRDAQRRVFADQLGLAGTAGKPVVIHAREADEDVSLACCGPTPGRPWSCIRSAAASGLLHAGLAMGAWVSFSGMITFRNWAMDDAVRQVPLDRLLLETDAPYLAPVPHRGKRNEPAFVRRVAERMAEVRGMPVEELIAVTGENAQRVFGMRLAPHA